MRVCRGDRLPRGGRGPDRRGDASRVAHPPRRRHRLRGDRHRRIGRLLRLLHARPPRSRSTGRSRATSVSTPCGRSLTGTARHGNGELVAAETCHAAGNGHAQRTQVRIGLGSCCVAGGSADVMHFLEKEIARRRLDVDITPVGCVGICHLTPMVEVAVPGAEPIVATRATPADVRRILRQLPDGVSWPVQLKNRLADAWRRDAPAANGSPCVLYPLSDTRIRSFIDPQVRIVTEHSGEMDPGSLEEFRARDGFIAPGALPSGGEPGGCRRGGCPEWPPWAWRRRFPHIGEMAQGARCRGAKSTSSVTETRATPGRSWTG